MYVYKKSELNLWTVGYYHPNGSWVPESDHESNDLAAERVAYLNGDFTTLYNMIKSLESRLEKLERIESMRLI